MRPAGHHHPVTNLVVRIYSSLRERIETVSVAGRAFPPGSDSNLVQLFAGPVRVVPRFREQPGQAIVVIASSGELDPARIKQIIGDTIFQPTLVASWNPLRQM